MSDCGYYQKEDEHDLVGGLSCFGSPKRKSQRTRSLSTRAYEKQPAGEETCSPARRIQQEWKAKNEVLIRARTRSYSTRQQLRVITESLGSGSSSGACPPPLPSPCEGLFESSRTTSRPLSLTIALPAPTTAYTGQLLSLPPDPDSRNPEEQGLPVPLPLSPLLSPALSHFDTGCAGAGAATEPPSPIVPPSSPFRTRESSCGHYSVDDDSWCHQSKHKRWISDSQSSDPCTASTCSNQDPRLSLSQDIESVINYAGQKLRKTSSPPKTWAEPRIIREDSVEDERCFGVGFKDDGSSCGGGGLTLPPMAVERLQTRRASSAVIVGVDGVEIVSDYHYGEEDEWFGRRTSEEDEEDAAASSSDSHVYVDAGTPRGEMGSGGGLKSRRSFLSRVKRSLNPLRPPARA
ncbi:hypothetical protein PQX77_013745 [Marasmius sp. AFHP31]|nr:hypothetical protein PQX77_013745 [Marasmius sp. AFHP31]